MMRLEEAVAIADSNGDGALSQEEFDDHRAAVVAAVLGNPGSPRKTAGSTRAVAGGASRIGPSDDWRFFVLAAGNVLLLVAGVAWMMRRRA